jgi:hypothetical protein
LVAQISKLPKVTVWNSTVWNSMELHSVELHSVDAAEYNPHCGYQPLLTLNVHNRTVPAGFLTKGLVLEISYDGGPSEILATAVPAGCNAGARAT